MGARRNRWKNQVKNLGLGVLVEPHGLLAAHVPVTLPGAYNKFQKTSFISVCPPNLHGPKISVSSPPNRVVGNVLTNNLHRQLIALLLHHRCGPQDDRIFVRGMRLRRMIKQRYLTRS